MKPRIKILLLLLMVIHIGCDTDVESLQINESDKLVGHWIKPVANDTELKLDRANALKKDAYGISFLTESNCIERSSGWCGTPPLIFADFQGSWKRNDSIITITIDNGMNGLEAINWKIKTLDDQSLVIERLR
ncbi:hypothetical protein LX77_02780 [Gelidibacter algens]|uniref:Lipocalin-like protein n=1 Tax=Gelidibacter algens TaxID=49280 RepID=A0A1A7R707_9FLAO|nr:hypothetical protein [Gelidibacter algens]OBX27254.1 hypothetical protein A9996_00595 [Gelidibacter algens]RAJ22121.1 hypothetical protein LX77_02780 [Gelidibacter algens]